MRANMRLSSEVTFFILTFIITHSSIYNKCYSGVQLSSDPVVIPLGVVLVDVIEIFIMLRFVDIPLYLLATDCTLRGVFSSTFTDNALEEALVVVVLVDYLILKSAVTSIDDRFGDDDHSCIDSVNRDLVGGRGFDAIPVIREVAL